MKTSGIEDALSGLFAELVRGASSAGNAFILNSGDAGLIRSLDTVSAAEASASMNGGATLAAHATHVSYGLSLMNRWAREGGNPFADAKWDDAWKTHAVNAEQWTAIRDELRTECEGWAEMLRTPRELDAAGLKGVISSVAHLAYHLGAMRQISPSARGPKEGTFS
ncbi:MAG: hypothetical protein ABIY52_19015 [Gemmatimonadaceae bacterium]